MNQSSGVNAVVGGLSTTDPDSGDGHTYSLVAAGSAANGLCSSDANNSSFNINNSDLRANDASGLDAGSYNVCVQSFDGTTTYEETFAVTVNDDVGPTINSLTPQDDSTTASATENLSIIFNENVQKGTGNIVIKHSSDNSVFESIDVTSNQVSVSGATVTINPSNNLNHDTGYYVEIDNSAFDDMAGNDFAGIADNTTWNFTTIKQHTLNVNIDGAGEGRVESAPAGINCGADCTEKYDEGTSVTLTATPRTGSSFKSWESDCDADGKVTIDSDKSCTANFGLRQYQLDVLQQGTGSGSIMSSPEGIDCGEDCLEEYDYDTVVILTPTPEPDSTFDSWSGDCDTDGKVKITSKKSCIATFNLNQYLITEVSSPEEGGSITCTPNPVEHDSTSSCTITTNQGYTLNGVSGSCGGSLAENIYTTNKLTEDCTVQANFLLTEYSLNINKTGNGAGTVSSIPPGLDCGTICSENWDEGTTVTLFATADEGSFFAGWGGDDDCVDGSVTITTDLDCTAAFNRSGTRAAALVPRTGQTISYASGDDGFMQAGVSIPKPRFNDKGDGTVTDNLTGLTWLKNANCSGTNRNWQTALDDIVQLNTDGSMNGYYCGDFSNSGSHQSDWRLPNIREIRSLTNRQFSSPAISNTKGTEKWAEEDPFINIESDYYWSSTTNKAFSFSPLGINFWDNGRINFINPNDKSYVWPVRDGDKTGSAEVPKTGQTISYYDGDDGAIQAGVFSPQPRFNDNGEGTVTDNLTGLVWLKNANCAGTTRNWQNALNDITELNTDGTMNNNSCEDFSNNGLHQTDWRLPNDNELWSLINFSYKTPALSNEEGNIHWSEGDPFNNVQSEFYWSSTTDITDIDRAWDINLLNGYAYCYDKDMGFYVWPVREGKAGGFYNLIISLNGTGSGTVTSDPEGIECGTDCAGLYRPGTEVVLTPTADQDSTFIGWSGDPQCSEGIVTMNLDTHCTATFDQETISPPVQAELLSPSGIILNGNEITFSWNAVAESEEYLLYIKNRNGDFIYQKWYTSDEAGCADGEGTCSIIPDIDFQADRYSWRIMTRNEAGNGPLSDRMNFIVLR